MAKDENKTNRDNLNISKRTTGSGNYGYARSTAARAD